MNFDGYDLYFSISRLNRSKSEMEVYYKTFRQEIVQTLLMPHIEKGAKILDIGCQFGAMSLPLAPDVNSLVCLDLSALQVGRARDNAQSLNITNAFFLSGDAELLPFQPNSFDVILLLEVIEHLADTASALTEIRRVLRPGGLLLIGTPQKTGLSNAFSHLFCGFATIFLKMLIVFKSRRDEFFSELYARGLMPPSSNQEDDNLPYIAYPKVGHEHIMKYSRRGLIRVLYTHDFQFIKATGVALFLSRMIKYDFAFPWLIRVYKQVFNPRQSFLLSRFGNQMYLLFRKS